MSEFLANIDKYPSEMISIAVAFLIMEIIRKIYNLSQKIKSAKLKKYIKYSKLEDITPESKENILVSLENYIFKEITGIVAEKKLREEIMLIHNMANGFLSYINFKRAFPHLKIKKGKLYIRVSWIDWIFAINDFVISVYLFGIATLLLKPAYSLIYVSEMKGVGILIAAFIFYVVSGYQIIRALSLKDVYTIKVFLDNPELNYYVNNVENKN